MNTSGVTILPVLANLGAVHGGFVKTLSPTCLKKPPPLATEEFNKIFLKLAKEEEVCGGGAGDKKIPLKCFAKPKTAEEVAQTRKESIPQS